MASHPTAAYKRAVFLLKEIRRRLRNRMLLAHCCIIGNPAVSARCGPEYCAMLRYPALVQEALAGAISML